MSMSILQSYENLEIYLKICADSYGENKAKGNPLGLGWEKANRSGFSPTK